MDLFEVILQKRQLFTVDIRKKQINQLYSRIRRLNLQASLIENFDINQTLTYDQIIEYSALIYEVINNKEFSNRLINLNYLTLKASQIEKFPDYCIKFKASFLMPLYNLLQEYVDTLIEMEKIFYIVWILVNLSTNQDFSQHLKNDLKILELVMPLLKVRSPQIQEKVVQLLNNLIADDDNFLESLIYQKDFQYYLRCALAIKSDNQTLSDFIYLLSIYVGQFKLMDLYCFIFDCVIQVEAIDYMCIKDMVLSQEFADNVVNHETQIRIICSSPAKYQKLLLIITQTQLVNVLVELCKYHNLPKIMRKQFDQMDKKIFYEINGNIAWQSDLMDQTQYLIKQIQADFKKYESAREAIIFFLISYISAYQKRDDIYDQDQIDLLVKNGAAWLLVEGLIMIKEEEDIFRMHITKSLVILMQDQFAIYQVKNLEKEKQFFRNLSEWEFETIKKLL
ncbi:hypothetical protein pb186bvf_008384 [Paramecium bursaria]